MDNKNIKFPTPLNHKHQKAESLNNKTSVTAQPAKSIIIPASPAMKKLGFGTGKYG